MHTTTNKKHRWLYAIVGGLTVAGWIMSFAAAGETGRTYDRDEHSVLVSSRQSNRSRSSEENTTGRKSVAKPHAKEKSPNTSNAPHVAQAQTASHSADLPTLADPSSEPRIESTERIAPVLPIESSTKASDEQSATNAKAYEEKKGTRNKILVAESNKPLSHIQAEAAYFHGVQAGKTTTEEMLSAWGDPLRSQVDKKHPSRTSYLFHLEPFHEIEIETTSGIVSLVQIGLKKPVNAERLAKQLHLDALRPVQVQSRTGELLGVAFPERGVLMSVTGGQKRPKVEYVLLQAIEAEPFILRAESELHGPYAKNIRDLKFALDLNPKAAKADWLLSKIYLATGQPTKAEASAASASEILPQNLAYQLQWAKCLQALGRYRQAVRKAKAVLDSKPEKIVQAEAVYLMGQLAALGNKQDSQKAITLFNQAIKLADSVATSNITEDRLAAKELLVDCHLAVAEQIATGNWQNKSKVVTLWIGRASAFAEEAIENENASLELRLRVAERAIHALASFQPMPDITPWTKEASETAFALKSEWNDVRWQRRIDWQLGLAYFDAMHIMHVRGDADSAINFGNKAIAGFAQGAKGRDPLPLYEHLIGQVYFRMGAIFAIHRNDHIQAAHWYDKATPLLEKPAPVSRLSGPQAHGDALVSMGVTYWQNGEQEKGMRLTTLGEQVLEQAVESKLVEPSAVSVAYGNLATMHKALGNLEATKKYSELARRSSQNENLKR